MERLITSARILTKMARLSGLLSLHKGMSAQIGEIHRWSDGQLYQKQEHGWVPVQKGGMGDYAHDAGRDTVGHEEWGDHSSYVAHRDPVHVALEHDPDELGESSVDLDESLFESDESEEGGSKNPKKSKLSGKELVDHLGEIFGHGFGSYRDFDDFKRDNGRLVAAMVKTIQGVAYKMYGAYPDKVEDVKGNADLYMYGALSYFVDNVLIDRPLTQNEKQFYGGHIDTFSQVPLRASSQKIQQTLTRKIVDLMKDERRSELPAGVPKRKNPGETDEEFEKRIAETVKVKKIAPIVGRKGDSGNEEDFEEYIPDEEAKVEDVYQRGVATEANRRRAIKQAIKEAKAAKDYPIGQKRGYKINGRDIWDIFAEAYLGSLGREVSPRFILRNLAEKHYKKDTGKDAPEKVDLKGDAHVNYRSPYDKIQQKWDRFEKIIKNRIPQDMRDNLKLEKSLAALSLAQSSIMLAALSKSLVAPTLSKSDDFNSEKWLAAVHMARRASIDDSHPMFLEVVNNNYKRLMWDGGMPLPIDGRFLARFNPSIPIPDPLAQENYFKSPSNEKLTGNIDIEPL